MFQQAVLMLRSSILLTFVLCYLSILPVHFSIFIFIFSTWIPQCLVWIFLLIFFLDPHWTCLLWRAMYFSSRWDFFFFVLSIWELLDFPLLTFSNSYYLDVRLCSFNFYVLKFSSSLFFFFLKDCLYLIFLSFYLIHNFIWYFLISTFLLFCCCLFKKSVRHKVA